MHDFYNVMGKFCNKEEPRKEGELSASVRTLHSTRICTVYCIETRSGKREHILAFVIIDDSHRAHFHQGHSNTEIERRLTCRVFFLYFVKGRSTVKLKIPLHLNRKKN